MKVVTITDIFGNEEILTGFRSLKRTRRVNGEKTLSFTVLPTEENELSFPMVTEESSITLDGEKYVIKSVSERSIGNIFFKQCEAIHYLFNDLLNTYEYNTYSGSMSIDSALYKVFAGTNYTYAVIESYYSQDWDNFGDDNKLSLFQKVLERYQAEFTVSGNRVTVRKKIGVETDFQFRYNYNIKTLEREIDTKNLSTYIKGIGKDNLTVEYTSPNAAVFGVLHAKPIKDDHYTNADNLLDRLKKEIQDTPVVSIKVDYADMRKAGFPYDVPNEGDVVPLIYEPMSIDIDTRIMEVEEEFDAKLNIVHSNVTLSNYKKDFAGTVFNTVNKAMGSILNDDGKIKYNVLDDAVKLATEAIKSAQTELKFDNGILAINPENPNEIVVFNSAGLGISRDGGKTFQEALTYQGLVASVGIIGFIKANTIQGGVLSSNNNTFRIDLDRSSMDLYSVTGRLESTISHAKAGDGREISYWAIESTANSDAAISIGKRNQNGSVTQSLFIDGIEGNLYSFAPVFFCHAEANFLASSFFKNRVYFEGAGRFESTISGTSWSITNNSGFRESAAFNPHQSGSGSIGQSQQVWGEAFIDTINTVKINGKDFNGMVGEINSAKVDIQNLQIKTDGHDTKLQELESRLKTLEGTKVV